MSEFNSAALNTLSETLNATGVLSESYRDHIIGLALAAYADGFKAGKEVSDPSFGLAAQEVPAGTPTVDPASGLTTDPDTVAVTTDPATIKALLTDGAAKGHVFLIDYVDAHGEETESREVEPEALTDDGSGLLAFDLGRDDYRRFRFDRVRKVARA